MKIQPEKVFSALGHPARLEIVRRLAGGRERSVSELVKFCGQGWSTVSRHLQILREAGVIASERRGLNNIYRLQLECCAYFLDCLEHPKRHPEVGAGKNSAGRQKPGTR